VKFEKLIPSLCLAGVLLSLAGILFAPALASLGMILCLFCGVLSLKHAQRKEYLSLVPGALLVLWLVCASLLNHWTTDSTRLLLLKLPLLLLPLLAIALKNLHRVHIYWALTAWVWLLYAAAVASFWIYLGDAAWYHQLVLESKPMPVLARMHHIEFSLYLAASVWAGFALWRLDLGPKWMNQLRWFTLAAAGINLVMLHLLSARTGLLAFYAGSALWMLWAFRHQWKRMIWSAITLLLMLLMGGLLVPSLRNRLVNTVEDFNTVTQNQDPNDKSFAQRWEAWKAAKLLIMEHPLMGLGMKELATVMSAAHESTGSKVLPWNRKLPHNQYLETGIQGGLLAMVLLLISLFLWVRTSLKNAHFFLLAMAGMAVTAFVFESLLEQQSGVMLCTLLPILAFYSDLQQNKRDEPLHR
jgi:O-antigen ligase